MTQSILPFNVLCQRADLPCQVGTVVVGHTAGSHRVTCDTGLTGPCEKYRRHLRVADLLPETEDLLSKIRPTDWYYFKRSWFGNSWTKVMNKKITHAVRFCGLKWDATEKLYKNYFHMVLIWMHCSSLKAIYCWSWRKLAQKYSNKKKGVKWQKNLDIKPMRGSFSNMLSWAVIKNDTSIKPLKSGCNSWNFC